MPTAHLIRCRSCGHMRKRAKLKDFYYGLCKCGGMYERFNSKKNARQQTARDQIAYWDKLNQKKV